MIPDGLFVNMTPGEFARMRPTQCESLADDLLHSALALSDSRAVTVENVGMLASLATALYTRSLVLRAHWQPEGQGDSS